MRTTINVDDDVLLAVQERARREKRSVGEVLSDLARDALTGRHRSADTGPPRHGFAPLPSRGGVVTNELIDQLREEDAE
jgi:hypothetical protein